MDGCDGQILSRAEDGDSAPFRPSQTIDVSELLSFDPYYYGKSTEESSCSSENGGDGGGGCSNVDLLAGLTISSDGTEAVDNAPVPSHANSSQAETPKDRRGSSDHSVSYVDNGRRHICLGRACEANNAPQAAIAHYKSGIQVLLEGAKDDPEEWRRDAVRIKTIKYLHHVEKLCERFFPEQINALVYMDSTCVCANSTELRSYKVVGIIDNVCLVQHGSNNTTYIMKILPRSSSRSRKCLSKHVIPSHVPHMAKLVRYYIKRDSIFLLLQYASGGKLWNHVSSYLTSSQHQSSLSQHNQQQVSSANLDDDSTVELAEKMEKVGGVVESVEEERGEVCEFTVDADDNGVGESKEDVFISVKLEDYDNEDECDNVNELKFNIQETSSVFPGDKPVDNADMAGDFNTLRVASNHSPSCHAVPPMTGCAIFPLKQISKSRSEYQLQQLHHRETNRRRTLSGVFQILDLANFEKGSEVRIPESCVRIWAAEIALALNQLHKQGIVWVDLHPDNILLGNRGHILLTYQSKWDCVNVVISEKAVAEFYVAPEITQGVEHTKYDKSCDWWSLGAITFELLCGKSFYSCHPYGIDSHFSIRIPLTLSKEASSFLQELLKYHPKERLGSGPMGFSDIQCHPFFKGVDWRKIENQPGDDAS